MKVAMRTKKKKIIAVIVIAIVAVAIRIFCDAKNGN